MISLKKHDRREQLTAVNFRIRGTVKRYRLEDQNIENRIYALEADGQRGFSGIDAMLQITKRVPFYWPLVPFIRLSILLGFGEACYDWIARHRQLIPVGQCAGGDSCRMSDRQKN